MHYDVSNPLNPFSDDYFVTIVRTYTVILNRSLVAQIAIMIVSVMTVQLHKQKTLKSYTRLVLVEQCSYQIAQKII